MAEPNLNQIAELDLKELRDSVNQTRACLRGLHKLARAANALVADLEDRLESFDARLQRDPSHPAQEAQHDRQDSHPRRVPLR